MATIETIQNLFGEIYECGDSALDALCECTAYMKWLNEGQTDEYLQKASPFMLEMIRAELESVLDVYAW